MTQKWTFIWSPEWPWSRFLQGTKDNIKRKIYFWCAPSAAISTDAPSGCSENRTWAVSPHPSFSRKVTRRILQPICTISDQHFPPARCGESLYVWVYFLLNIYNLSICSLNIYLLEMRGHFFVLLFSPIYLRKLFCTPQALDKKTSD